MLSRITHRGKGGKVVVWIGRGLASVEELGHAQELCLVLDFGISLVLPFLGDILEKGER